MTVLEEIIANKKREVSAVSKHTGIKALEKRDLFSRKINSLSENLIRAGKTGIIAEFKRKSPSRGLINPGVSLEDVTTGYRLLGAAGLSILTDYKYFGGSDSDLTLVRKINDIPILRKEFIITEYQVIEAKAIGADVILLIAAALNREKIRELASLARSIGLEVLLEIHCESELSMVNEYINMVGVNNRDLNSLEVDTGISLRLADRIPSDFIKVSESGINSPAVVMELKNAGFGGFLIGEFFMNHADPVEAFAGFVSDLK
jgi:indole-3-glycerol phosphate synthase